MPSAKLIEKRKELEAKQEKLHKIFEEAGDELDFSKVKCIDACTAETVKKLNDELTDIGKAVDGLVAMEDIKKSVTDLGHQIKTSVQDIPQARKGGTECEGLGDLFVKSKGYEAFKKDHALGVRAELDIPLKTVMTTAAGWAPETTRIGRVVDYATRPIQVMDLVPYGRTDQAAVVYMEETGFTDTAAEKVEDTGASVEATLALSERSSTVRNIVVHLPVTMEQLEDVAQVQTYINNRLSFMVRRRFDYQIINGSGVAPNLAGILATANVQSFVLAGDRFDAVYDAIKRVRVTGRSTPNVTIFHPNDWQQLRLARDDNGNYILGQPSAPGPDRIWGLPVVEADVIPEGTVLGGDFAGMCGAFERRGIVVEITDSHASEFVNCKYTIRATLRVAFVVFRPVGFCKITGF